MIKAEYVSVWNGGYEVVTNCLFNPITHEVTDVETSNENVEELYHLDREFIRLTDGTEIDNFSTDDRLVVDGIAEDEEF